MRSTSQDPTIFSVRAIPRRAAEQIIGAVLPYLQEQEPEPQRF